VPRIADIASGPDAKRFVAFALQQYGRLDVVINNAGILWPRVPLARHPIKVWAAGT